MKRLAVVCRMSTDKWASWREWLLRDSLCKSHEKNRCEKCPRKIDFHESAFPFGNLSANHGKSRNIHYFMHSLNRNSKATFKCHCQGFSLLFPFKTFRADWNGSKICSSRFTKVGRRKILARSFFFFRSPTFHCGVGVGWLHRRTNRKQVFWLFYELLCCQTCWTFFNQYLRWCRKACQPKSFKKSFTFMLLRFHLRLVIKAWSSNLGWVMWEIIFHIMSSSVQQCTSPSEHEIKNVLIERVKLEI